MFSKIKKYVIGFFVLAGGILFAFLSGKSAGRKKERLGGLNKKIKETEKSIKATEKSQKAVKKTLESKKKSLEEIKKQRESFGVNDRNTSTNAKDAADYLKKFSKGKK